MQTPILDAFGVPSHGKIVLRTRLDNDIDNIQPWSYSKIEWSRLGESPNQFEKLGARRTSEACPVYNCHGLTFGNRRTQVDDSYKTISGILLDDGFDQIPESEVRLGDIVVYYDGEGNAAHSGIVLNKGDLRGPVVWSKWGKSYEMIHALPVCPYDPSNVKFYRMVRCKFEEIFGRNL